MPLTPSYTWSETETSIHIEINNVSIKDQSQIFCSDRVIKLNSAPYILVLDLNKAIDDDRSLATVFHGRKVVLQLVKVSSDGVLQTACYMHPLVAALLCLFCQLQLLHIQSQHIQSTNMCIFKIK